MSANPHDFYAPADWAKIYEETKRHETPSLVVHLGIIERKYREFCKLFPYSKCHYAVKANPAPEVVSLLRDLGSNFDVASVYELDLLLSLGVDPSRISFGNTIKKARDIQYAYEKGVRLFATDSLPDVDNLAKFAPGSDIFIRLLAEGSDTADWPLSRKFGCHPDMVVKEAITARDKGLNPRGISFHVGSQQHDIGTWSASLVKVSYIFDSLLEHGIKFDLINMGGGLPAKYISKTNPIDVYAEEITKYLKESFGDSHPDIIFEPGRSMVGDAGVLTTEVALVSWKSDTELDRWVYIDAGIFNGLIETVNESIKYPIYCEGAGEDETKFTVAGPTCDSMDIMYEWYKVPLPADLAAGDRMYWMTAGAYTASYASVCFNGFPPIKTYFVRD